MMMKTPTMLPPTRVLLYVTALLLAITQFSSALSTSNNSDKLVLVTGGSRGIGRATCLLLAQKGYNVALNYCQDEQAAQSVVDELAQLSSDQEKGKIVPFQCDVSKPEQVLKMFKDIEQHFQQNPTGLVNNAGVMEPMQKDITKIENEILLRDYQTNACGPFYCTKEFVQRASTNHGGKGGSIVCVSSISAESAQILAYGMSKAALEAMVAGLSKTLPLEGIRINIVQPGLIDTGLASPEILQVMAGVIPARRAGEPKEVAAAIEYFLSDASRYCSGTKFRIAGGL
jgi:NAD(P)-dependent dehydrogenase (short-subunit alcohol dehydrogenase family)